MRSEEKDVEGIIALILTILRKELGNVHSPFMYGTFVAAEAADANLSRIELPGTTEEARFVPRLSSTGALTAGDTVICIKTQAIPMTIIGRIVGDITLATA